METSNAFAAMVLQRRSIKPALMNGQQIDPAQIAALLHLADWAPTHGRTEPWRFVVFSGAAKQQFCLDHAALYKTHTTEEQFTQAKYQNLQQQGDKASHIIAVYMKRQASEKIPLVEEIAAVAAAMQNILLGAQSMGIAVLWSTGGMTHHPAMKTYFKLETADLMMGLLYLGYTDQPAPPPKRNIPLEEKIDWR